jgi:thiol-disulfide isomerase/thioredoxin
MAVIAAGAEAPPVPGVELDGDPRLLWFYKVTCPVCQMAAPIAQKLSEASPGRLVGVGQDPDGKLRAFAQQFGTTFEVVSDPAPYDASSAYGLETVPTLVLVQDGRVADVAESWDRDGYNRMAARLAELTGEAATTVSDPRDGLPPFRPG